MTRLAASLVVAVLMTATFAMPAAAGRPGAITAINAVGQPGVSTPYCTFDVSVAVNPVPKDSTFFVNVAAYRIGTTGDVLVDATASQYVSARSTTALSFTVDGTYSNGTYWFRAVVQRNQRDTSRSVDEQNTTVFSVSGTTCPSGVSVAHYP